MDRAIGILSHATAHAAGVIGKDSAHHACINRRRIRSDAAFVWFQGAVDEASDDAGLEANVFCIIFDAVIPPVFGNIHEDAIRHGLTRETRPCRAEGHRDFVLLCEFEKGLDFADGVRLHHCLRHKPKIRCVVGIRNAVNESGVDAGNRNDLGELRCNVH